MELLGLAYILLGLGYASRADWCGVWRRTKTGAVLGWVGKPQRGDPIKAQGEQPCKGDQTLGSPR